MSEANGRKTSHQEWLRRVKAERGQSPKAETGEEKDVMLSSSNRWLWDGFLVLSEQRGWNETGPQKISLVDIVAYFTIVGGYTVGERKLFTACIIEMDRVYIDHIHKSKPAKGK